MNNKLSIYSLGIPKEYFESMSERQFEDFLKDDDNEIPLSEVDFSNSSD